MARRRTGGDRISSRLYLVFLALLAVLLIGREMVGGVAPMSFAEFLDWISGR